MRNFAQEHPDVDITTLHPGFIYGPFGRGQVYNTPAPGTNKYVYTLIDGERGRAVSGYDPTVRGPPLNSDVRDVAKAHVLALKLAPSSRETPKRFVLSSSTFTWLDAAGAEGPFACDHGQRTAPRAYRYAGHEQNGECARVEGLCQVAGHPFGYH